MGISSIDDMLEEYRGLTDSRFDNGEYLDFLHDRYQDPDTRQHASMLLYYYFDSKGDRKKCKDLVDEIKLYKDNKDVVYFLFKFYGRNLHISRNRLELFELVRRNDFLFDKSPMRYHYFLSISEFYNYRWRDGKEELTKLKTLKQANLNPDFFLYWKDEYGNDEVFDADLFVDNKVKMAKVISPFYRSFYLVGGDYKKIKEGDHIKVKLRFLFEGVRAEIVG